MVMVQVHGYGYGSSLCVRLGFRFLGTVTVEAEPDVLIVCRYFWHALI